MPPKDPSNNDNNSNRFNITDNAKLDTQVIYVHGLQSSNFENPSVPTFENRLLSELGDPKDEFRWDVDVNVGDVTFGYRMHYIGPMYVNAYEDFNALPAACSAAGCPPNNADYADVQKFEAVFYHDLRMSWDLKNLGGFGKAFQFYAGVDNLLNTVPPLGSTATGAGSAIYDIRGRSYYAGFKAKF